MSNCNRIEDDAAFVDCLALQPVDQWSEHEMTRLLVLAAKATHVSAQAEEKTPGQWQAVGNLLHHAEQFIESYTDHLDRCRPCAINWQNLKHAIAVVRQSGPHE